MICHARRLRVLGHVAGALLLAGGCAKSAPSDSTARGSSALDEKGCPSDLLAARGTPCTTEGTICNEGAGVGPRLLMCNDGTWTEMSVPPPPPPPPSTP